MPTVLDLVGVTREVPNGRSLWPFALTGSRSPTPASTSRRSTPASRGTGRRSRAWCSGGFKFIDLPIPELYDLAADPGEQTNLFGARKDAAARWRAIVGDARRRPAGRARRRWIRDTEQRLRSLGYVVHAGRAHDAGRPPRPTTPRR